MIVFLSHSFAPDEAAIAARLRAVAAAYDIQVLLPDRLNPYRRDVAPKDTRTKIAESDAMIAMATVNALHSREVSSEVAEAIRLGKPVVALVEQGVTVNGVPPDRIVQFDRANPMAHEKGLMLALQRLRNQPLHSRQADWSTALMWLAGIALGMVALNALVPGDEK